IFVFSASGQESNEPQTNRDAIYIGPCTWILDRKCPDKDVRFWLFTSSNPDERQAIHVDDCWEKSNLSTSFYNPNFPVKIIIHGYNSDMQLTPLIDMKDEYLQRGKYNLFFTDWSVLGPAPCYPAAVHNTKHVGKCIAQLISRIRETGNDDIHLIGFSLGAQITNYVSKQLELTFRLPRITGLDPAMPLFVSADVDNKLDASDAEFVDVFHTNALVQGKIEQCGHVDFYLNGGIYQPGCHNIINNNIFQCSHHRAPDYFAESIRSVDGFWGWRCQNYIYYLLGMCTPTSEDQTIAGEDCRSSSSGMFFIKTNSESPFALGRVTNLVRSINTQTISFNTIRDVDPLMKEIDAFGKLAGNFNNLPYSSNHDSVVNFFRNQGSDEVTHEYVNRLRYQATYCADVLDIYKHDPEYGKTWMFFPNGEGKPQVIELIETNPNAKFSLAHENPDSKITLWLYNKKYKTNPKLLKVTGPESRNNFTIDKSYDSKKKTKFIIHGWQNNLNSPVIQLIKDAYLKESEDFNIVAVDWGKMAQDNNYLSSAASTKNVGKNVAAVIDEMVIKHKAHLTDFHIIG
ncbi:CLUMA_CG011327, isoform A, partial [Clunio marinus]